MLLCIVLHCYTLHCTAMHYTALHWRALHYESNDVSGYHQSVSLDKDPAFRHRITSDAKEPNISLKTSPYSHKISSVPRHTVQKEKVASGSSEHGRKRKGVSPPIFSVYCSSKLCFFFFFLSDPGKARGCSTNTFVINSFINPFFS